MPRRGVENRAEQLGVLAGLLHDQGADPRFGELLSIVEQSDLVADPSSVEAVNLRQLRREYERERRMPRALVEESARVAALAAAAWHAARDEATFAPFAPWLERIIDLARQEADAVGFGECRYDALIEDYEPGMSAREVNRLLSALKAELVPLVQERTEPARVPAHVLRREFPVDRQRLFAHAVASALGFDLERGRLDTAQHPFCTSLGPGDVRIALRFHRRNFALGFFILLHEVGHGLYDQGLDPAHYGTPMGEAASLGLHESQSRLWENLVGRSRGFWEHFYPRLKSAFHEALHDVSMDAFLQVINRVAPGPSRARADPVSYDLHIAIRVELEQAMLSGDLPVRDLPGAWAEAYRRDLGVTPKDDVEGCLQDGHWSEGMIGYFPTYTLGNVYAAQLFARARADLGDLERAFAAGEFGGLLQWLRDRVHRHGRRWSATELVERATGLAPSAGALLTGLKSGWGS